MLFQFQKFPLIEDWKGLFYYLRHYSSNILNSKFIDIIYPETYISENFCDGETSVGPSGLIDGDAKACYTNRYSVESDAYFIIDLLNNTFKLTGLGFKTACCNPTEIKVEAGSNQNSLKHIGTITGIEEIKTEYFKSFYSPSDYQVFKFSMPNFNSCDNYDNLGWRFQIAELEFFGILNPKNQCTHMQKLFIQYKVIIYSFACLVNIEK